MPCTAKKFENRRDGEDAAGVPDVDYSLTTRELARMIQRAHLDFASLPEEEFDPDMGQTTERARFLERRWCDGGRSAHGGGRPDRRIPGSN